MPRSGARCAPAEARLRAGWRFFSHQSHHGDVVAIEPGADSAAATIFADFADRADSSAFTTSRSGSGPQKPSEQSSTTSVSRAMRSHRPDARSLVASQALQQLLRSGCMPASLRYAASSTSCCNNVWSREVMTSRRAGGRSGSRRRASSERGLLAPRRRRLRCADGRSGRVFPPRARWRLTGRERAHEEAGRVGDERPRLGFVRRAHDVDHHLRGEPRRAHGRPGRRRPPSRPTRTSPVGDAVLVLLARADPAFLDDDRLFHWRWWLAARALACAAIYPMIALSLSLLFAH